VAEDSTTDEPIDASALKRRQMRGFRRQVQLIFQDPYESLNPWLTRHDIIAESLVVQKIGNSLDQLELVSEFLTQVGLTPTSTFLFRYPHDLSDGQRQRVAIARALIL